MEPIYTFRTLDNETLQEQVLDLMRFIAFEVMQEKPHFIRVSIGGVSEISKHIEIQVLTSFLESLKANGLIVGYAIDTIPIDDRPVLYFNSDEVVRATFRPLEEELND